MAESFAEHAVGMNDAARPKPRRRWLFAATAVFVAVSAAFTIGELLGWPFLAVPLQHSMSETLNRRVRFSVDAGPNASAANGFQVRFVGGVRLVVPEVEIAGPAWSAVPHMFIARNLELKMRYVDF